MSSRPRRCATPTTARTSSREVKRDRLRLRGAEPRGGSRPGRRRRAVRRSPRPTGSSATSAAAASSSSMSRDGADRAADFPAARGASARYDRGRRAARRARTLKSGAQGKRPARHRPRAARSTWSADRGARSRGSTCSPPIFRSRSPTSIGMKPERARELRKIVETLMTQGSRRRSRRAAPRDLAAGRDDAPSCSSRSSNRREIDRLDLRHPRRPALFEAQPRRPAARSAARGSARSRRRRAPLRPAWRPARRVDRAVVRRPAGRCGGCGLPPACWPTSPGRPIRTSAPTAAIEMALHGNWVAVSPAGRVVMAQALSSNFGTRASCPTRGSRNCAAMTQLRTRAVLGRRDAARPAAVRRRRIGARARRA